MLFIYSSASGGDAAKSGKITLGKFSFDADTLVYEGAHKIFAHDHGIDGWGNHSHKSKFILNASSAKDSLSTISSTAR
jgi:hypothetical protein